MVRTASIRIAGALVAAGLALGVAAGCGSSDDKEASSTTTSTTAASPARFADGVCSAVETYESAVKSAVAPLTGSGLTKDGIESAAGDLETATKTFISDVKSAGAPHTAAGTQAKAAMGALSSALTQDAATIEKAVSGISGVRGIAGALAQIQTVAATAKIQVASTIADLQNLPTGELKSAFESSSACKSVTAST